MILKNEMAQRLTMQIDLTNEDSDSGDTNVSSQPHPPPISLPTTTTTTTAAAAAVESSTTTNTASFQFQNNVAGIANCCGDSNITAENVCQMATTSAAAAAAQTQNQNQSSDNNALEEGATGFDNREVLECPICLQTCIHPARLPCGHIFCFLCVKGVAYKNRRCAMCRREIPVEFLDFPQLVNGIKDICATTATDDGYQWFYEGRNGWWQYDDRTSQDIEDAYRKGDKTITILVAGYVYTVDLENMMQLRQNEPARCRRVKRDLATIPKKGVAGLRIEGNTVTTDSNFADYVADTQLLNSTNGSLPDGFWDELEAEVNDNSNNADIDEEDDDDDDDDDDGDDDDFEYAHELGGRYMNFQRLPPFMQFGNINMRPQRVLGSITSTMAVGHAIRMANDIIGSTLAHADEFSYAALQNATNGVTTTTATTAATTTTTTALTTTADAANLTHRRLPPICDDGEQTTTTTTTTTNTSWPTMSRNSVDSLSSGSGQYLVSSNSGRTLPTTAVTTTTANRQNLIAQAVAAAAANHQAIDMFEQTLNNFNALTLHNIVDSSDDNDDDHIVTTTPTQTTTSISSTTSTNTNTNTTNTLATTTTTTTSSSSSSNEPDDNTPVYKLTLRF